MRVRGLHVVFTDIFLGCIYADLPDVYEAIFTRAHDVLIVIGELCLEWHFNVAMPLEFFQVQKFVLFVRGGREQPYAAVGRGYQNEVFPPAPVYACHVGPTCPFSTSVSAISVSHRLHRFAVVKHQPSSRRLYGERLSSG
ncbi:hypothetical protein BOVATA_000160 [Babesia ovata]|uniref:Secreted protein n=1 Tax=Babesia ovata TaxID=189622 RepID=A0A2H6K6B2_9APIC|nr:uncharacterized protein BOVATA_000160 [Babesia ovata]GBE58523.1 hypothetical protein BOVATA_000160 [Babesia ovata]